MQKNTRQNELKVKRSINKPRDKKILKISEEKSKIAVQYTKHMHIQ